MIEQDVIDGIIVDNEGSATGSKGRVMPWELKGQGYMAARVTRPRESYRASLAETIRNICMGIARTKLFHVTWKKMSRN